ncbi:hypothetical protein MBLNU230_g2828t1 [Neophaeotheca triangularis]
MSKASLRGLQNCTRLCIFLAALFTLLLGCHLFYGLAPLHRWKVAAPYDASPAYNASHAAIGDLPCKHLPGSEDVTVVMRTGATEITDKLPTHLNTTFKCYKDYLIFSDYPEDFLGFPVHDALAPVDDAIKETNNDFMHYNRLRKHGRESLEQSELSGQTAWEIGKGGKKDNAGWKLDKWKFLPMVNRTLEMRPSSKWYLFVEPDSYVVWSSLLRFLDRLDPSEDIYTGSENKIGEDIFAHGGSAFVLSHSAIERAAGIYRDDPQGWHELTARHWAGDCILGKALHDAGVPLDFAWPMFQGDTPFDMNFTEKKGKNHDLWCSPAISYHHVSTWEIEQMWEFEQRWLQDSPSGPIHHDDVFHGLVMPEVVDERRNWTNASPDVQPDTQHLTTEECRELCKSRFECLQYSKGPDGCSLFDEVRIGSTTEGYDSGWIRSRVEAWNQERESCSVRGWLRPEGLLVE